jgi:hypothetical protein
MKRLLLISFLLFCAGIMAQAQVAEKEPNDTRAVSDTIHAGSVKTGTITSGDYTSSTTDYGDYFKTVLPADGTIRIIATAKNNTVGYGNAAAAASAPGIAFFDKAGNSLYVISTSGHQGGEGIAHGNIPANGTASDTFYVYARAADTAWIAIYTGGGDHRFSYTLRYDVIEQSPNDVEPNYTLATALALAPSETKEGHSGYYGGAGAAENNEYDGTDFYKIVLPADGSIKIYASAVNYSGNASGPPAIGLHDKKGQSIRLINNSGNWSNGPLNIRSYEAIPYGSSVADTMNAYARAADTLYISVGTPGLRYSNRAYSYKVKYEVVDQSPNDVEQNYDFPIALPINAGETKEGHTGYYDGTSASPGGYSGGTYDETDVYRFVMPADGTIRVYLSAKNTSGIPSPPPSFYVYDKAKQSLSVNTKGFFNGSTSIAHLAAVSDTASVYGRIGDTVYLAVNTSGIRYSDRSFQYKIRVEVEDQSSNDKEPNDSKATATDIKAGDTIKGHIGYTGANGQWDQADYYRAVLPAKGSIKIYSSRTNVSGVFVAGYTLYVYDKAGNVLGSKWYGDGSSHLQKQYDTMTVNCINTDTVFFMVYRSLPDQYTFRYETISRSPIAALDYTRLGNEFGFTNASTNTNTYKWDLGNNTTSTKKIPALTTYVPGHYEVKLITTNTTCNFTDTAKKVFDVVGVEKYTPNAAGSGGDAILQIFGGGLDTATKVILRKGGTDITPREKYSNTKKNHLTAVMDLHFAAPGVYDVIIQIPNQTAITYTGGFTISALSYPYAWSQVTGPGRWRTNVDNPFTLVVGNSGNVTASGVVVAMVWPKNVQVTWKGEDYKPSYTGRDSLVVGNKIYSMPRSEYKYIYDSTKATTAIDSFEGKPYDGYIRYFLVRHIPAGSTVELPFIARSAAVGAQKFITFAHRPNMLGSCATGNYEDYGNDMTSEFLDAADMIADKTKMPLFQAFTKTSKIGQKHMQSAASYAGKEFWAWWDGYETDHDANLNDWLRETDANNQFAIEAARAELANFLVNKAISNRSDILNKRLEAVNEIMANNPTMNAKSFEDALQFINKNGGQLSRLTKIKGMFDDVKNLATLHEKIIRLQQLAVDCPELQQQLDELLKQMNKELDHNTVNENNTNSVTSMDPNAIYGPTGVGANQYVNTRQRQPFLISFENIETATADAQVVRIIDTLDKTKFDLSSFEFGNITIGTRSFRIPKGRQQFVIEKNLSPVKNMNVRINGSIDTAKGIVQWQFTSLDPATGDVPSLAGFLSPNVTKPQGEGSVSYLVNPKILADGTVMQNRASIIFDANAPILTNTWQNIIDVPAPVSSVSATLEKDTIIRVRFTGNDAKSGVNSYTLYVSSDEDNKWVSFAGSSKDTLTLMGAPGRTYRFYSVATDKTGNTESKTATVEAMIKTGGTSINPGNGGGGGTNPGDGIIMGPNPSAGIVTIRFNVPDAQQVTVNLYSITGQLVNELYNNSAPAGSLVLTPDLRKLNAGMYLVKIRGSKGLQLSSKLVIAR